MSDIVKNTTKQEANKTGNLHMGICRIVFRCLNQVNTSELKHITLPEHQGVTIRATESRE